MKMYMRHDSMGDWLAVNNRKECASVAKAVYAHIHSMGSLKFPCDCLSRYVETVEAEYERALGKSMLIASGALAISCEWRRGSTMFRLY